MNNSQLTQGYPGTGYAPQMQAGYPGTGYAPQMQAGYPGQQPVQYPGTTAQGQYHVPQVNPVTQGQYPPQQMQPGTYPPQQMVAQPGQYPMKNAGSLPQGGAPPTPGAWDPSTAQQYQGDDIPDQDLDENAQSEPLVSSAPPPPVDASLPGYEQVAFTSELPAGPPPAYEDAVQEAATVDTSKMSSMTDAEAKDALLEYVSQQCCYGKGAAEKMQINDIKSTSALHYTLETFTESRSTKWHYVPYAGGFVDGPHIGPAPGPWDIQCSSSSLFKNEVLKMEVPHTASVRPCHGCFGSGFTRCWRCFGRGNVRCSFCHGSGRRTQHRDGHTHHVSCHSCHGRGRKRCFTCHGTGCVRCKECTGFGQIKQYIQLTVTFTDRLSDHIVERTDMPDHLIRGVTGDIILEQIALRVGPVVNFFEEEINRQSNVLVNSHATSWPTERILQQRQKLSAIPVYECDFSYKNKSGRFWVYGKQHAVYTQDYPHTCCCCNIM